MAQFNITITEEELHELFLGNSRDEAVAKLLEKIFNAVLLCQSEEQLKAKPHERTDQRTGYRNGYYDRGLTTRVGTLDLRVPRHRGGENFSTELFSHYQRSKQALLFAVMGMAANGISIRKVKNITEELCGKKFSKSTVSALCKKLDPIVHAFRTRPLKSHYPFLVVDALYIKVREDHKVQSGGCSLPLGSMKKVIEKLSAFRCKTRKVKAVGANSFFP
nr:transposase [Tepidanaerobacter syntrophicus]